MEKYLALLNTLGLLIIAILTWITKNAAVKTELNTNSMKDALVASTAKEQFHAGKEQARIEGEVKAAALLKDR